MGNPNSKDQSSYQYAVKDRSMALTLVDNYPYPQQPSDTEVEKEFNEILKTIELSSDKLKEIKAQPFSTKWKLICRHKQLMEDSSNTIDNAAQSQAHILVENLKTDASTGVLENLRVWLEQGSNDDIQSFIIFDGVAELLNVLEVSELCSRKTKNVSKQVIILKTLENLINNDQVMEHLLQNPNIAFIIMKNFNAEYVELCTSSLEILNAFCWISNEGHSMVMSAINTLKEEKGYKYPFEPFIETLKNEKNIILVENIITFINTLIESPLEEEERTLMRSQFVGCGVKKIYEDIKDKIAGDQYFIDDCLFDISKKTEDLKIDRVSMLRLSTAGKTSFIERDQEEFEKHMLQVLNQIEVFEKAVDDFGVNEMTGNKEDNNTVDFSDINSLFDKLKNDSMTNQSFTHLLSIFQQLSLIPSNEKGRELWGQIASILTKTTGIDNHEGVLKIGDLKNVFHNSENLEQLESKLELLEANLRSRDDEIKKLTKEKNQIETDALKYAQDLMKKYDEKIEGLIKEKEKQFADILKERDLQISNLKANQSKQQSSSEDSIRIQGLETKISVLEKQLNEKNQQIKDLESQKSQNVSLPPPPPGPGLLPPPPPGGLLPPPPGGLLPPPPPGGLLPPPPGGLLPPPPGGLLPPPPGGLLPPPPGGLLPPPPGGLLPPPPGGLLPPPPGGILPGPPPIGLLGKGGPPMPPGLPGLPGLPKIGAPGLNLQNIVKEKIKEKKKPRVPLRGLMWTVVAMANIKGSVWEKVDDEKIDIDIDFLEKEFATKKVAISGDQQTSPEKVAPKVQKITLLTPERVKNMEICLGKLKLSNTALCEALFAMDEKVLNLNMVETLLGIAPTDEEIKTVLSFEGDVDQLGNPERFVLEISGVPGFLQRLQAFKFSKTYKELTEDLKDKLFKISNLLDFVPKDERLKSFLEHILAIGNYLNGTTARGGAYGFKLDALDKINDLKMMTNPKKNLLMYLIEKLETKANKEIINPNEDLSIYDMASKLPISQMQTDFGEIKKGSKYMVNAMNKPSDHKKENVVNYFKETNDNVMKLIEEIEKEFKVCEENYNKACLYLMENPKDSPSDKLIEKIYKFWVTCKNAKTVLVKEKEAALKEQQKKDKINAPKEGGLQPNTLTTKMADLKMGNPDEIIDVMRNRRQTKKFGLLEKSSLADKVNSDASKKPIGGVGLPGMGGMFPVQLKKVAPPENKDNQSHPQNNDKQQNLNYLSNILVQGAARKKTLNKPLTPFEQKK